MKRVEMNDVVIVTYEGLLSNNEIFESSEKSGPLEFQVGSESVLPGFEKAIIGMTENEQKTICLEAENAYGLKKKELIHVINRKTLGDDITPRPGMVLGMTIDKDNEKHKIPAMIVEVEGEQITVDFNHPLAGQALTYKINVQSITKHSPA